MKKIVLAILVAVIIFSSTTSHVLASAEYPTLLDHAKSLDAYRNDGQASLAVTVQGFIHSMLSAWLAIMGHPDALSLDPKTKQQYAQNSALGQVANGIAMLYYQKPVNTNDFVAYYAGKINPQAYAQGIGFAGLSPLLNLWRAFRNISYTFLIIIMISVGFAIMFRAKIDPRTVISIQSALPRIIVTLLLITFSFAIAGLLIDLMYVLMFLAFGALNSAFPFNQLSQVFVNFTGGNLLTMFNAVWTPGKAAIDDIILLLGGTTLNAILGIVGGVIGITSADGLFGMLAGGTVGATAGYYLGPNLLVGFIIFCAMLIAFIRILFMLLSAYIQIIVGVIFAPLQLMFGAIPNNDAFGSWLKSMVANLAVFPITTTFLLLGQILTTTAASPDGANLWRPPGFGGNFATGISGLIGLAIVFIIPSIAGSVKEALKAKPAIPVGLGTITSPIIAPISTAWNIGYQWSMMQSLFNKPKGPISTLLPPEPKK